MKKKIEEKDFYTSEEMKEILYKRYVNRTGEEPKYFFAL